MGITRQCFWHFMGAPFLGGRYMPFMFSTDRNATCQSCLSWESLCVCVCVCVLHLVNSLSLDPREMTGPLLHDPVCTRCDLLSFSKSKLIQHFYWRGFTSPWSEVCPSLLYFPLSLCPSLIIRLDII